MDNLTFVTLCLPFVKFLVRIFGNRKIPLEASYPTFSINIRKSLNVWSKDKLLNLDKDDFFNLDIHLHSVTSSCLLKYNVRIPSQVHSILISRLAPEFRNFGVKYRTPNAGVAILVITEALPL